MILKLNLKALDIFALTNILFFVFISYFAYFDRFIKYRGSDYIWEFYVYAFVIIVLILFAWKMVRHVSLPAWLLVITQFGILIHFLGGLAFFGEDRVYDLVILGLRYDKYVHFLNAIIATIFVLHIPCEYIQNKNWLGYLMVILIVLGLGAVVEIIEYVIMLTIELNGVGKYDNNMQDLIANLAGVIFCISLVYLFKRKNI